MLVHYYYIFEGETPAEVTTTIKKTNAPIYYKEFNNDEEAALKVCVQNSCKVVVVVVFLMRERIN